MGEILHRAWGGGVLKEHMEPAVIEGPGLDDPGLPDRIRNRDPEALRAVVEAYLGQVLRAARGAGLDLQEAEEVVQATSCSQDEALTPC